MQVDSNPTPPLEQASGNEAPTEVEAQEQPNSEPETMPSLEQLLRQAEVAAQEHHDAWLRAKAEADNIRRRAQSDVAAAHKYALENFATELLPVKDSLEAALASSEGATPALISGIELTLKQLNAVFAKFQITELNPLQEKFDPHKHQAMTTVESPQAPNTVVHVMQKGYTLHERVLRPALVTVAKAAESGS